jgi:hypothetical protein
VTPVQLANVTKKERKVVKKKRIVIVMRAGRIGVNVIVLLEKDGDSYFQ